VVVVRSTSWPGPAQQVLPLPAERRHG
jgi:hypothetical protein